MNYEVRKYTYMEEGVHHTCHRLVVVALYLSSTGAADGLRKSDNALPPDSHINQ